MVDRSANLRAFFARYVAAKGGAHDPRIEQAFAAVPREPFAGPGPWYVFALGPRSPRPVGLDAYVCTPDDNPAFLYQDTLVALDPARGINIGEPSLHARCLDQLAPQEGNVVLHVGAGAGYYTALLAHLVGPTGRVPRLRDRPGAGGARRPESRPPAAGGGARPLGHRGRPAPSGPRLRQRWHRAAE